jgi:hypothetical protein
MMRARAVDECGRGPRRHGSPSQTIAIHRGGMRRARPLDTRGLDEPAAAPPTARAEAGASIPTQAASWRRQARACAICHIVGLGPQILQSPSFC